VIRRAEPACLLRFETVAFEVVSMRADIAFTVPLRPAPRIAAALVIVALWSAPSSAQGAGAIDVFIDRAAITKVPDRAVTIVVGNPLIADVSIQAGGTMVVTGKGYGVTNLIALDRAGKVLAEQSVRVKSPADSIVVYRGVARESYSCAPDCERRITLGDTPDFFDATLAQSGNRNSRAQAGQAAVGGSAR
jgi:Flp pilus assembly secretin CpaC